MDAVNFLSTFMLGNDVPWICYTNIKNIELYLGNQFIKQPRENLIICYNNVNCYIEDVTYSNK